MSMKQTKEQFLGVSYDELLVENAKLREQVASLTDRSIRMADKMDCLYAESEHMRLKDIAVMGELGEENERLKAENAKLRELLQRTWDAFHDATAREFVTVKNELRELGIEVDG